MDAEPSLPEPGSDAPLRPVRFGPRDVRVTRGADGTIRLRSPHAPGPMPRLLTDWLVAGAAAHPGRVFIATRDDDGAWRSISWGEALREVERIAQALLDRALPPGRTVAILSDAGIEHALLRLAALHVGVPVAQVTPAYSLLATDFTKLARIVAQLTPGLVFVSDAGAFARAIGAAVPADVEVVACRGELPDRAVTRFEALRAGEPTEAVARAHREVAPDAPAQILFTSGSTGAPKGVVLTHHALVAAPRLALDALPALGEPPPVLLSWLPWHHGSGCLIGGIALCAGGSLHIDDGRPLPGLVGRTARNLLDVSPTVYFTVPRGLDALLPLLRDDAALRERFFRDLRLIYYSGAALPSHLWDATNALAVRTRGERVAIVSGYAATETGVFTLCANWDERGSSPVGLPVPGVELELVPDGHKLEARVRGIAVTPGYWRQPELTAAAFDEGGFYRTGDALRFVDPDAPERGLEFDGRLGEDFKLSSGTWVRVGALRERFIDAGRPLIQDVVLCGADRDHVGALIVPDLAQCRGLCPLLPADAPPAQVLADAAVRGALQAALDAFGGPQAGTSTRVERALLLDSPPSGELGELTDKGSINTKALIANRRERVDALFTEPPPPDVLVRARGNR
jgi:feruloyl-CoA synthase